MTNSDISSWQPSAELATIRRRAAMNRQIRHFFETRDVMEVETPILSSAGTSDPFIDSFTTELDGTPYYLHTSPELPMKRLLAAGSGAIYQIAKVFREGESGPKHNPEFSLLEWYRPGFDLMRLMEEVRDLVQEIGTQLESHGSEIASCEYSFCEGFFCEGSFCEYVSYQNCFENIIGINPHQVDNHHLYEVAKKYDLHRVLERDEDRDRWLDLLMSHVIEPNLGGNYNQPRMTFIYDYPATQAALARIEKDGQGQSVARRFELYIAGVELANGFYELADGEVQRQRFETDNQQRISMGKPVIPIDENFIQALHSGFPDCSGVALGLDRLLMLLSGKRNISEVLCFPISRS